MRLLDLLPVINFNEITLKVYLPRKNDRELRKFFTIKSAHPRLPKEFLGRKIYCLYLDPTMFKRGQRKYKKARIKIELNSQEPDLSPQRSNLELIDLLNCLNLGVDGDEIKLEHPDLKDNQRIIRELPSECLVKDFFHYKVKQLRVNLKELYYNNWNELTSDLNIILK